MYKPGKHKVKDPQAYTKRQGKYYNTNRSFHHQISLWPRNLIKFLPYALYKLFQPFHRFFLRGAEDSNPQPRDLESRALPIELAPLFYLSMKRVLFTPLTVFFELHPLRMLLLVFCYGIVPSLALSTCKYYNFSHRSHILHLTQ